MFAIIFVIIVDCDHETSTYCSTYCSCLNSVDTENVADKAKAAVPSFAPSKWETVDESELEAQGDYCLSMLFVLNVIIEVGAVPFKYFSPGTCGDSSS